DHAHVAGHVSTVVDQRPDDPGGDVVVAGEDGCHVALSSEGGSRLVPGARLPGHRDRRWHRRAGLLEGGAPAQEPARGQVWRDGGVVDRAVTEFEQVAGGGPGATLLVDECVRAAAGA